MNSSSSAEPFVAPMMSFVGLENSSQKQFWDWEAAATATSTTADQNPNTTATFLHHHQHPSSLTNANTFFDCAATITPLLPMSNNPFYPASAAAGSGYQAAAAGMLIKSEDDAGARRIGLNLGHRTYFPSGDAAIDRLFRRSRGVYQVATQQAAPRCQAEGCKADLSGAKHYHRRHKVCEFHSKATVVLVAGGFQQRFCQQCSRFHVLSEFDEAKRSCRKRLADHNRRRRKPQPSSSTTPTTTTTTKVPSAPQHLNTTSSTEKSQQATPKSTTSVAATKGTITTSVMSSTVHNSNQANLSMEIPKDYLKEATLLRNGPTLSLGGTGGFGFQASYQQQQHISSSSPSSSTFFLLPHNFLGSNANEPPQPEQAYHHHHQSDDLLHHSQNVFEMDFI